MTPPASSSIDPGLLRPGTVVETTFVVGVVIATGTNSNNNQPSVVQVQLWRLPGRSLGTATTAYLQPSAVRTCFLLLFCCGSVRAGAGAGAGAGWKDWKNLDATILSSFRLRGGLISQLSRFIFFLLPVLSFDYIMPMLPNRLPQHSLDNTTDFTTITSGAGNDHHR